MAQESFNFKNTVRAMTACEVSRGEIAVWGGHFTGDDGESLTQQLTRFLAAWDFTEMSYCVWEYAHRIEFTDKMPPDEELDLLERGRVFGVGGDLSLRRDSGKFYWHFVGSACASVPQGFDVADFWDDAPEVKDPVTGELRLRVRNETALLWGSYETALLRWQEDRVGWADLSYPSVAAVKEQRVKLHYRVFTNSGQVSFVWLRKLATVSKEEQKP
jgi:hypothetical protein